MQNIEQLFSKPLPSTRRGVFYNTFPYPTKISPEAIAVYIASATLPGETVLDPFAGSGSTGIATLLCEHPTEEMKKIAQQLGVTPIWGARNCILYEIGTYATFATETLLNRIRGEEYSHITNDFIKKAEILVGEMYAAKAPNGEPGMIRYAIWTEILVCPDCGAEIDYFTNGASRNPAKFNDTIKCPCCCRLNAVGNMQFSTEFRYDKILKKTISTKKRKIAWLYGITGGKNWDRAATADDEILIKNIENATGLIDEPKLIEWGDLYRAGYHYGITHLHHFYTIRNYCVMSKLWKLAETYPKIESDALKLLLLSYNGMHSTLMTRVVAKHDKRDFVLTGAQSGVLYVSKLPVENNIILGLRRKAKQFEKAYTLLENCSGKIEVRNQSSTKMSDSDQSIDFTFTDPPFGGFIPYAEVNQINELWLANVTKRSEEIIISNAQGKSVESYGDMLAKVFEETERVTKKGHYIAVVFHAAKASVWRVFSEVILRAGLKVELYSMLDKNQSSFKQIVSKDSVQGDPMFLLKKSTTHITVNQKDLQILNEILATTPHETELEIRHCYSLYIGECLKHDVIVTLDAKQVYDHIRLIDGGK